jgi:hypothetical protein
VAGEGRGEKFRVLNRYSAPGRVQKRRHLGMRGPSELREVANFSRVKNRTRETGEKRSL